MLKKKVPMKKKPVETPPEGYTYRTVKMLVKKSAKRKGTKDGSNARAS